MLKHFANIMTSFDYLLLIVQKAVNSKGEVYCEWQ